MAWAIPCRLLLVGTILTAPCAASGVQWTCALSPDLLRLHCEAVPDAGGPAARAALEARAVSPNTATVRGVSYPLDPRRSWVIDLWSVPSDPEFVRLLARSVLCWRRADCTAVVDGLEVLEPLQQTAVASRR